MVLMPRRGNAYVFTPFKQHRTIGFVMMTEESEVVERDFHGM